jgi:hypothetical protein
MVDIALYTQAQQAALKERPWVVRDFLCCRVSASGLAVERRALVVVLELAGDIDPEGGVTALFNSPGSWLRMASVKEVTTGSKTKDAQQLYLRSLHLDGLPPTCGLESAAKFARKLHKVFRPNQQLEAGSVSNFCTGKYRLRIWAEATDEPGGPTRQLVRPAQLDYSGVQGAIGAAQATLDEWHGQGFIYDPYGECSKAVVRLRDGTAALKVVTDKMQVKEGGRTWLI